MASWGNRESEWAEWAEVMPRSQCGTDTFEHDLINGGAIIIPSKGEQHKESRAMSSGIAILSCSREAGYYILFY